MRSLVPLPSFPWLTEDRRGAGGGWLGSHGSRGEQEAPGGPHTPRGLWGAQGAAAELLSSIQRAW